MREHCSSGLLTRCASQRRWLSRSRRSLDLAASGRLGRHLLSTTTFQLVSCTRGYSLYYSAGNIVQKVVQASIKALEQNLAVIEQAAIEKAAKYLSSAVFRDFYGVGGSAQVARDAAFKFLRIGVRASVFDDSQMMLMSACLLEKTDVAVAFSHCGQTAVVIEAVRQARRNGARIIAVTNCRTSILAQESDVILCPNVEESLITGENAAARIAQLNIVDALFLAVAQKSSGIA